ncbi:Mariner Mos1 transposase [Anthophora retusa]
MSWDTKAILLVDHKDKSVTITGEYSELLEQLKQATKDKRRGKWSKCVLLLHDNAPLHKSNIAIAALNQCGFQTLNQPLYSPDMACSDYYLF